MDSKKRRLQGAEELSDIERLLGDLDTGSSGFEVDFELGVEPGDSGLDTPIDFSVSRELVPVSTGGSGRSSRHDLARMNDHELLNREVLREKRIVYPEMEDYALINSFREIRTRLLKRSGNKNFIAVVASVGRGMSTTNAVVNIGTAFCYEGEHTALLVDCQNQEDNIARLLDRDGTRGLSDYVETPGVEVGDIIFPTGIKRMRLIPFGTRTDAGSHFVTSEKFHEFLVNLKRRHSDRFLFINAPPLEVSADAAILSEIADFVIVIVPYGKVSRGRLNKAIKSLPPEKFAGVVMSDCKRYV